MLSTGQALHDSIPSPTVSASRKKQKITPPVPSRSFGGPSPSFHPQTVTAPHQPSSSAKRGSGPGSKGKKQKPVSREHIYTDLFYFCFICINSLSFGFATLICIYFLFAGSNITWCIFSEAVSSFRTRWKESST